MQKVVLVHRCSLLLRRETYHLRIHALRYLTLYAVKSPSADEEYILGIHVYILLIRVFAPSLRRHVDNGAFQHLQQRLLYAFTTYVTGDRGVLRLTGNLVNLVDEDNTSLGFLDIVVRGLKETDEDRLHIFSYIAGLGEGSGIADGEWYFEHLGDSTRQEGLARTCRTYQQNIALLYLHIIIGNLLEHPFIVVINRYGEEAFGFVLPYDILVKKVLHLLRRRQFLLAQSILCGSLRSLFGFLRLQKRMTGLDTIMTDPYTVIIRTRKQLGERFLLVTEEAQPFILILRHYPLCV